MNLKEVIILKINALESLKREWLKIAVEEKDSVKHKALLNLSRQAEIEIAILKEVLEEGEENED
ncbi:hypothetical protein EPT53_09215 [Fusobacterium necrophorum]|uniref:Uncharacterized protein n=1 Tax=Fusobacterium necrophorum TaxID=859 RepID=A0A4Q2KXJ2_9FUSO|nr:hypothetical protein [Fusobacterium necrophorum]RXZ68582.1 hypothetical protein EPT53_09215 [Fusobacterium necrophorum]